MARESLITAGTIGRTNATGKASARLPIMPAHARQTRTSRCHRRHRGLQEPRSRAAPARAGRRGAGGAHRGRARVRHADDFPGRLGPRSAQRPVGSGSREGDVAHRARALGGLRDHRAGHRRLHRAPRHRPGRRSANYSVPGHRRADRARAGDEPRDVGERRHAGQRRHAQVARRPRLGTGRGRPGLRRSRRGPHARADATRRRSSPARIAPSGPLAGKRVLLTAGPTRERIDPGALHQQSQLRKDGFRGRRGRARGRRRRDHRLRAR